MADSTPLSIACDLAKQGVDGQRSQLDNIRARAATLISAAALATSFLGVEALKDTKPGPHDTLIADRSLQLPEILAIAAFLGVGIACLAVLWPQWRAWPFQLRPDKIVDAGDRGTSIRVVQRAMISTYEANYATIAGKLQLLFWVFQAGVVLLALEVAFWLLDLTT